MKMQRIVLNIGSLLTILFLSSCGGGGGGSAPNPQPGVPVTPTPSQPELYIGYYTESSIADTNDPTPGVLYLYLPDTNTSFTGEFFFSYVGCQGSFDTGQVSGAKTGSSFSGTWSGDIDSNISSGTFTSVSSGASSYTGTWTRNGGTQNFSFGTAPNNCGYTFAGNGDFTIFKVANGTTALVVDLTNPFTPIFNFNLTATAADAYKVNVFDKACLINGGGVSGCLMWENQVYGLGQSLPSSSTYGVGGTPATPLVSGNTYIATVLSYDINGNVLDFASSEFLVP